MTSNSQTKKIDINCDMGEIEGVDDKSFIPYVSSCNISCGGHTSNFKKIEQSIRHALEGGVKIGAHPSYPDCENFGRVSMRMKTDAFIETILSQIEFLDVRVKKSGGSLHHVKAHGALYNDMMKDEHLFTLFLESVKRYNPNLLVYGFASDRAKKIASDLSIRYCCEVFMDRAYMNSNQLMPRNKEGAVLSNVENVISQLGQLLSGYIIGIDNQKNQISWDTICIHSDTENAFAICSSVFEYLNQRGYEVA